MNWCQSKQFRRLNPKRKKKSIKVSSEVEFFSIQFQRAQLAPSSSLKLPIFLVPDEETKLERADF